MNQYGYILHYLPQTPYVPLFVVFGVFVLSYLLGSLNTSVIVGKIYGKDIRDFGSKNAGLTNTYRVLGKPAAALVLVGDVLKGVIACVIGIAIGVYFYWGLVPENLSLLAAGMGVIIGNNWPVYFGFRGGKGALTALAVLFMINWVMALICLALYVTMVVLTRYSSLSTICATTLFAILAFIPIFGNPTLYFYVFSILMALIIIFKHRENVKRLISGTENKLVF